MSPNTRPQFAALDFCKMFLSALVCGVVFSLCAAAITLAIASAAEASTLRPAEVRVAAASNDPHPGVLMIGEGCENEPLMAVERDWRVRISERVADVVVAQKFVLPKEGAANAGFDFVLPTGAKLITLTIRHGQKNLNGYLVAGNTYVGTSHGQMQKLARRNQIMVWTGEEGIHTDQLLDLVAGDVVTIEYHYQLAVVAGAGFRSLQLPLQAVALNEGVKYWSSERPTFTSGNVTVEWKGDQPIHLLTKPQNAIIERNAKGIAVLNWFAADLEAGATLDLSWAQG